MSAFPTIFSEKQTCSLDVAERCSLDIALRQSEKLLHVVELPTPEGPDAH